MNVAKHIVIIGSMLTILLVATAWAEPGGPETIGVIQNERANLSGQPAVQIEAQAGNVTELAINATIITDRWQGYYGNISGRITLDDGQNNTLYDWSAGSGFSPIGEIYAANNSITSWSDVICVQMFGNGVVGESGINVTNIENAFGMAEYDGDGVNETFLGQEDITIGTTFLPNCPSTNTYVNNLTQSVSFNETLLTENATGAVIFAAEVSQDTQGFDGNPWDFQMIVGENGNVAATTPYFFYVELV